MNREIEAEIARTRADMGAQLDRLQAIDDPVESIQAALAFEDACRQVILDLTDMCRGKLDDVASWALGPSTPRSASGDGGESVSAPSRPRPRPRKRAARATKATKATKARKTSKRRR